MGFDTLETSKRIAHTELQLTCLFTIQFRNNFRINEIFQKTPSNFADKTAIPITATKNMTPLDLIGDLLSVAVS